MQQIKSTKQIGVIKEVASNNEKLTDSLVEVTEECNITCYPNCWSYSGKQLKYSVSVRGLIL